MSAVAYTTETPRAYEAVDAVRAAVRASVAVLVRLGGPFVYALEPSDKPASGRFCLVREMMTPGPQRVGYGHLRSVMVQVVFACPPSDDAEAWLAESHEAAAAVIVGQTFAVDHGRTVHTATRYAWPSVTVYDDRTQTARKDAAYLVPVGVGA